MENRFKVSMIFISNIVLAVVGGIEMFLCRKILTTESMGIGVSLLILYIAVFIGYLKFFSKIRTEHSCYLDNRKNALEIHVGNDAEKALRAYKKGELNQLGKLTQLGLRQDIQKENLYLLLVAERIGEAFKLDRGAFIIAHSEKEKEFLEGFPLVNKQITKKADKLVHCLGQGNNGNYRKLDIIGKVGRKIRIWKYYGVTSYFVPNVADNKKYVKEFITKNGE